MRHKLNFVSGGLLHKLAIYKDTYSNLRACSASDRHGVSSLIQELCLGVGESKVIQVTFNPAYRPNAHSRIIDTKLTISYREHPHMVSRHFTFVIFVD